MPPASLLQSPQYSLQLYDYSIEPSPSGSPWFEADEPIVLQWPQDTLHMSNPH